VKPATFGFLSGKSCATPTWKNGFTALITRRSQVQILQVEEGGKAIFSSYERTIWAPAPDILNYSLLAPYGSKEWFLGLVRGTVRSRDAAAKAFNEARQKGLNAARRMGSMSHMIYFREPVAGGPTTLEVLGVDLWSDLDGMATYYKQYDSEIGAAFVSPPEPSVWKRPAGEWIEW
jgi:hypothetical protein